VENTLFLRRNDSLGAQFERLSDRRLFSTPADPYVICSPLAFVIVAGRGPGHASAAARGTKTLSKPSPPFLPESNC
jgi:hypothetical protein